MFDCTVNIASVDNQANLSNVITAWATARALWLIDFSLCCCTYHHVHLRLLCIRPPSFWLISIALALMWWSDQTSKLSRREASIVSTSECTWSGTRGYDVSTRLAVWRLLAAAIHRSAISVVNSPGAYHISSSDIFQLALSRRRKSKAE